jgi:hypothetical protein
MSRYPVDFDSYWERANPDDLAPPPLPGRADFEKEPDPDESEPEPSPREEP